MRKHFDRHVRDYFIRDPENCKNITRHSPTGLFIIFFKLSTLASEWLIKQYLAIASTWGFLPFFSHRVLELEEQIKKEKDQADLLLEQQRLVSNSWASKLGPRWGASKNTPSKAKWLLINLKILLPVCPVYAYKWKREFHITSAVSSRLIPCSLSLDYLHQSLLKEKTAITRNPI